MASLVLRGRTWHMRVQVPKRFSLVESRREIVRSLKTSDRPTAEIRAARAARIIHNELSAKLAHDTVERPFACKDEIRVGASQHFLYNDFAMDILRSLDEVTAVLKQLPEKLERVLHNRITVDERTAVSDRTITQLARDMASIRREEVRAKNAYQLRVWTSKYMRVAGQIKEALGEDIVADRISGAEARKFQKYLRNEIAAGKINSKSANTKITLASSMIKHHRNDTNQDVVASPFAGLWISDPYSSQERKPELPERLIEDVLLNEDKVSGLNDEARDIILVCLETGCRHTEVVDLPSDAIHLDHEIPCLDVSFKMDGDEKREVKNVATVRRVPLVGVALEAMKRHPRGFPRYRGNGNFSCTAGSYFRRRGLMPTGYSLGGLRHSFEGRLRRAGVDNDVVAQLMGHSLRRVRGREIYGDGLSLLEKQRYHLMIAFPVAGYAGEGGLSGSTSRDDAEQC